MNFTEEVNGSGVVTLGCHVEAIETVLIKRIDIGTRLNQHLTYLDIATEGREVNSGELFADGGLIDPFVQNIILIIRIYFQYFLLGNSYKSPKNDRIVLKSSPVQQREPITILNMPNIHALRKALNFLSELVNQCLLLLQPQLLKAIDQAALLAEYDRLLVQGHR